MCEQRRPLPRQSIKKNHRVLSHTLIACDVAELVSNVVFGHVGSHLLCWDPHRVVHSQNFGVLERPCWIIYFVTHMVNRTAVLGDEEVPERNHRGLPQRGGLQEVSLLPLLPLLSSLLFSTCFVAASQGSPFQGQPLHDEESGGQLSGKRDGR